MAWRKLLLMVALGLVASGLIVTGGAAPVTWACSLLGQSDDDCEKVKSAPVAGGIRLDGTSWALIGAHANSDLDPVGLATRTPPREAVPGAEDTPGQDNFVPPVREQCTGAPDVCNPSLVISLSDIASFKASVPVLAQMQPSGWALKNLPMNLVASASVEEISGELLGFPASVRFTPVSYAWDYGDGTSGTSITRGASWEALGVPELTKTATSHVYRERGEYAVTVSVVLSAEYRFAGQPWRPIAGTLQIAGAASPVSVKTVRTVLVRGTCLQYPNDPGC